jgi:hypothetical protein
MAGLDPAIHLSLQKKCWITGSGPVMTAECVDAYEGYSLVNPSARQALNKSSTCRSLTPRVMNTTRLA